MGALSDENYNFLHGLPMEHCGTWGGPETCAACHALPDRWKSMVRKGESWDSLRCLECEACARERERRTRLLAPEDCRTRQELFVSAPYIHENNQPK